MKRFLFAVIWIVVCLFGFLSSTADACTLWAAAGSGVDGAGTLIHKNRDWRPDHQQDLRLVVPSRGYRYISLYTTGNEWVGTKAGVNSEGLVIVTASAPPNLDKREFFQGRTNTATLLSRYASVAAALAALEANEWRSGPQFIMMADKNEIVSLEFMLQGDYTILERTQNGRLVHTNHYLSDDFLKYNPTPIAKSSQNRWQRIQELLAEDQALNTEVSLQYSKDPVLWRKGQSPTATRTLSTWTVRHSADGTSVLFLTMANPGKPEKSYTIPLQKVFAGEYDLSQVE